MPIDGDTVKDDRGSVTFVNGFDFKGVKRFYIVKNKEAGYFRGWHGHKKETKYVFVVKGEANIYWRGLDRDIGGQVTLKAAHPQVLYIAPGYANAAINLTKNTEIMYFSTATVEESKADDYRFPKERWAL